MNLKNRWHNLSSREQNIVGLGGIFISLCILYFFIWAPLSHHVRSLRTEDRTQTALLSWMKYSVNEISSMSSDANITPQSISSAELLNTVNSSLKENGLKQYATNVDQAASGEVNLSFNTVPFDSLTHWLTLLWQKYHVRVIRMQAVKGTTTGLVQAVVVIRLS